MEENNFENAAKKLMESEEAVNKARAEADAIVENAAANAEAVTDDTAVIADADAVNASAESPEIKLDDSTQAIDVDYISVDSENTADAPEESSADNTAAFDSTGPSSEQGFDAGNPRYEEHIHSYDEPARPAYAASSDGSYGSYGSSRSYGQSAAKAHPGYITKGAFVFILIIAMILTMLASVGITTAYTTYLHNKTVSSIKTSSDNHATNYTLTQSDESLSYKSIIQKTQDSVVSITTESVTNDIWMQNYVTQGAGSGVIIDSDGYIITCEHVIEGARKITVTTRDGKEYNAKIVGADADNDIAVIKIDATGLQAVEYGDSSKLEVGDATVVIGNPLGTLSGTVTTGIISALDRKLTIDNKTLTLLQTDASINPGNSGGGMFDKSGNLIGIVEAKSIGSDIDGLGFATPINKAAEIAKKLIENEGKNDTESGSEADSNAPKIGIMVTEVNDSIAKQYGYSHGGLLVRSVTSPQASLSGLDQGDIIYKADGKDVATQSDLTDVLAKKKAGDKLQLTVAREDGSTVELTTVLVSASEMRS